jgi:adenylate kinase family enzyme
MIDLNYIKELDKMLNNAISSTQTSIAKVMKMRGISDSDKENLKKAQELTNKSKKDLVDYKKKLKNDFNIQP